MERHPQNLDILPHDPSEELQLHSSLTAGPLPQNLLPQRTEACVYEDLEKEH